MSLEAIKKALSVSGSGSLENYLPAPLATEVIAYIRELNFLRKHFPSFNMGSRVVSRAKKNGALSAYYVPDGVTATSSSYSTGKVTWTAKKLMSFAMLDEEAVEDSQPDVVNQVLMDFAESVAEAEELAMLDGDPTHLATAPTPASATTANWYIYDPRLIFEGVFPTSVAITASTKVAGGGAQFSVDMVNKALFNLGKYGRNRANLMGLMPSIQASQVRENSSFKVASTSGQALASFITGLGAAGESALGLVAVIYGIPFYEVPQANVGSQICLLNKKSPELGDRRQIKYKNAEVIEADQRKYVVSERIAFNYNYRDAMVAIDNLSVTL